MRKSKLLKFDPSTMIVTPLVDDPEDRRYWLSKTPLDRLEAVEVMRQIIYGYTPSTARLCKVLKITQRA
jgi:hypothetical protein